MKGHVRMIFQQRFSDLIRSEAGGASRKNALIAGTLFTGVVIAGFAAAPRSAMAFECPNGFFPCGPEWQGLCCPNDQACCWGSYCKFGGCP